FRFYSLLLVVPCFFYVTSSPDILLHTFPTRRSSDLRWPASTVSMRFMPIVDSWPSTRGRARLTVATSSLANRGRSVDRMAVMGGDRKSTRLNSSHVKISYAVFCLKKKNKEVKRFKHY